MLTTRPVNGCDQQVGLARQERRNLYHVCHLGHLRRVRWLVDVGQNRHTRRFADLRERAEAVPEARSSK